MLVRVGGVVLLGDVVAEQEIGERLEAMAGFFEAVTELHDQMKRLPTGTVRKLLRMGTKMRKKAG